MPFSRRQTLAVKIPAVLSLLLLMALGAMSVASYLELRRGLIDMATARLQRAATQMAAVLSSTGQRVPVTKQLMVRPEVRAYLQSPRPELEPALHEVVRTYLGAAISIASVELWDAAGNRIFSSGASFEAVPGTLIEEYKNDLALDNDVSVGRLRMFPDGIRYPIGGRITQNDRVLGYLVERRGVNNPAQTRQTVQLLTGFIGSEASMVVGNADGTLWSDLETELRDVPIRVQDQHLWDYQRSGRPPVFAWATPINVTPWAVAIEFPRDSVLEPLRGLVNRLLVIAATVLVLAAAAGWWIMRRITTPLVLVTEAAEAVAESRPHVRINTDREDEIGRLADSFNTMAMKVEQSRADLEMRVEQRTAELSAANRELEAFSYSVSHDLRAPLRAIVGFVQILDEDYGAQFDAGARKHLDRVKVNARRMGQLIDDLLSFSRIGRASISRQIVDMQAMARSVADETLATSGRSIELTIDPLPACTGEPALLRQVFANLLSNAVKFTGRVEGPAIHIGSTSGDGETIYFVRDNGVGFDERYAEKLFGVFQRLHRVDDFEGTGVGLAIVHRIISRHGGRVWAEGRLDQGATFFFALPGEKPA